MRLERENERLKIERIKLEREREEMIRPRAFEDKRVRSSLYPDEKRFDEFRLALVFQNMLICKMFSF